MYLYCALKAACGPHWTMSACVVEGWSLCQECRDFVINRGLYHPDGRLMVMGRPQISEIVWSMPLAEWEEDQKKKRKRYFDWFKKERD